MRFWQQNRMGSEVARSLLCGFKAPRYLWCAMRQRQQQPPVDLDDVSFAATYLKPFTALLSLMMLAPPLFKRNVRHLETFGRPGVPAAFHASNKIELFGIYTLAIGVDHRVLADMNQQNAA